MILVFGTNKSIVTPVWGGGGGGEEKPFGGKILSRLGILEHVSKPQLGMYFGELGCLPFTQTTRMEIFGINTKCVSLS